MARHSKRRDTRGGPAARFMNTYLPEGERRFALWLGLYVGLVISFAGPALEFLPAQVAQFFPGSVPFQQLAEFLASSRPWFTAVPFYTLPWFLAVWLAIHRWQAPRSVAAYALMLAGVSGLLQAASVVRAATLGLLGASGLVSQLVSVGTPVIHTLGTAVGIVGGAAVAEWGVRGTVRIVRARLRGTRSEMSTGSGSPWHWLGSDEPTGMALARWFTAFYAVTGGAQVLSSTLTSFGLDPLGLPTSASVVPGLALEIAGVGLLVALAMRGIRAGSPRSIWFASALGAPSSAALVVAVPFTLRSVAMLDEYAQATWYQYATMAWPVVQLVAALAPLAGVWLALRTRPSGSGTLPAEEGIA